MECKVSKNEILATYWILFVLIFCRKNIFQFITTTAEKCHAKELSWAETKNLNIFIIGNIFPAT